MKTYSPKDVVCIVGTIDVRGYSEGTFINAEYDEDAFTKVSSSDGEVTRSKNANESALLTLTLKSSADSNDELSKLASKDRIDGSGVVPLIIKDNSGRLLLSSANCWVRKAPAIEKAKEISDMAWQIDMEKMLLFAGGNN